MKVEKQHPITISRLQVNGPYVRESLSVDLTPPGLQDQILYNDFDIPTRDNSIITARLYRSKSTPSTTKLPIYLYYHGGGFLFGTLSAEDAYCARVASAIPILILSVNYRHTPVHRHPTQTNDAWDAFEWTLSHLEDLGADRAQLLVGGSSAGAALASAVAVKHNQSSQSQQRTIKGLVLGIPWLYHLAAFPFDLLASKDVSAYYENRFAPVLPRTMLEQYADLLCAEDPDETSLFVGNAEDDAVKGLPRTAFLVAGRDPLRDDALLFNEKLNRNG